METNREADTERGRQADIDRQTGEQRQTDRGRQADSHFSLIIQTVTTETELWS